MRLELFDYPLPQDRIAQQPIEPRDASRLLVLDPLTGVIEHRRFSDLPGYVEQGDLLVFNDTRVLPARLLGRKRTGGAVEVLLLRHLRPGCWEGLARPGRRLPPGAEMEFGDGALRAMVVARAPDGSRELAFVHPGDPDLADDLAMHLGTVPLPPYITASLADAERYQTLFARVPGSAAAPTAGLHFTPALVRAVIERGAEFASITLHVGIATFRPVRTPEIEDHRMHIEAYAIPPETASAIADCRGRVVAVGTSTLRCLESAAVKDGQRRVRAGAGETELYITPGYRFRVVDALLTNFHMPRSALLILAAAFAGRKNVLRAYTVALREGYRFLSFGDAMWIPARLAG